MSKSESWCGKLQWVRTQTRLQNLLVAVSELCTTSFIMSVNMALFPILLLENMQGHVSWTLKIQPTSPLSSKHTLSST